MNLHRFSTRKDFIEYAHSARIEFKLRRVILDKQTYLQLLDQCGTNMINGVHFCKKYEKDAANRD